METNSCRLCFAHTQKVWIKFSHSAAGTQTNTHTHRERERTKNMQAGIELHCVHHHRIKEEKNRISHLRGVNCKIFESLGVLCVKMY